MFFFFRFHSTLCLQQVIQQVDQVNQVIRPKTKINIMSNVMCMCCSSYPNVPTQPNNRKKIDFQHYFRVKCKRKNYFSWRCLLNFSREMERKIAEPLSEHLVRFLSFCSWYFLFVLNGSDFLLFRQTCYKYLDMKVNGKFFIIKDRYRWQMLLLPLCCYLFSFQTKMH